MLPARHKDQMLLGGLAHPKGIRGIPFSTSWVDGKAHVTWGH
jgi:hypothetical protein